MVKTKLIKQEEEDKYTTVRLYKSTHLRLIKAGSKSETFDMIINRLLDSTKK